MARLIIHIGIETKVLKIDWGPYERPAELPNFETLARKHRFQILGKACRDNSIDSLFLGHHQDDQAETVLMRLISGHRMFGLGGIRRESEIPECYGIHGVHESGGSSSHETPRPVFSVYRRPEQEPAKGYTAPSPLPTETGGIRVYRPLLGFTKDRLTATCKADDMKWFEDHTNKDPTLTSRNAIRHIYSSHAMPAALSVPSLVNLAGKFEAKHDLLLHKAKACLRGTIQSFSNRSGIITVELPSLSHLKDELSRSDMGLVAALILRQLVQYVTPDEQIHLQSFHGAISRVFPELSNNDNTSESKPTSFTVSGVQFKPLPPSFTKQRAGKKWAWLISRQPYNAALPRPGFQISPPVSNPPVLSWTPWTLYDGRFWIRVQNRSERLLVVRPFEEGDLMGFRHRVGLKMHAVLKDTLRKLAPEGIRWTLPAIVIRSENGKEKVLALPTLGISVLNSAKDVGWEVRYKKVDMEMLDGEIGTGM